MCCAYFKHNHANIYFLDYHMQSITKRSDKAWNVTCVTWLCFNSWVCSRRNGGKKNIKTRNTNIQRKSYSHKFKQIFNFEFGRLQIHNSYSTHAYYQHTFIKYIYSAQYSSKGNITVIIMRFYLKFIVTLILDSIIHIILNI